MTDLYAVRAKIEAIVDEMQPNEDGELPANIDQLDKDLRAECNREQAVIEDLIKLMKNREAEADALEKEEKAFAKRKAAAAKAAEGIKVFLEKYIGIGKVKVGTHSYNRYKNGTRVEFEDEAKAIKELKEKGVTEAVGSREWVLKTPLKKLMDGENGVKFDNLKLVDGYVTMIK